MFLYVEKCCTLYIYDTYQRWCEKNNDESDGKNKQVLSKNSTRPQELISESGDYKNQEMPTNDCIGT